MQMKFQNFSLNYCCMDCGGLISKPTALKGGGRCRSCSRKGELSWFFGVGGINHPNYKPERHIKYYCKNCGDEICYDTAQYGKGYCSKCKQLGKRNHMFGKRRELCHHTKYSELESIKNNTIINSSKWKEFRIKILKRDNYTCQYCGNYANEIHHKKPRNKYPELCFIFSNIISVCKSCHCKIEPKYRIPIIQFNKQGKFIRKWDSIIEAQKSFNPNNTNIWSAINHYNNQQTAYGFIWRKK